MKRLMPLLVLVACSHATNMTDVYRDPAATQFAFNRVAAIVIAEDQDVRRAAEDAIVTRLGPKGVASYTILAKEDEKDAETVRAKLKSLGIDGAVTMSLLSLGEEPIDPRGEMGDSGKSFSGYYGHHGRGAAESWEQVARIQTQIFSINENKLLWSAATKTFNPSDAKQLVIATAAQITDELKRDNLLR
jgi:hypothetical protein